MYVEKINALFGNMSDPVVSQVESTLSPPEPTMGNAFPQTRPRIELWDITSSSREGNISYTLFDNPLIMGDCEEVVEQEGKTETTFRFPILDLIQNVNMRNIPLSSLPVFYGKSIEDPNTYLFEFDVLCRSYNYLHDSQKLN